MKNGELSRTPKSPATSAVVRSLNELQPDPHNANKGTGRGRKMLEKSLRKYGAGRSILIDREGRVIAGNKTVAALRAANPDAKILVVPTDGTTLIAVQRTDLDLVADAKARELGIADNRVGEVSLEWDPLVLKELEAGGVELVDMFTNDELSTLLSEEASAIAGAEECEKCPACGQRVRS